MPGRFNRLLESYSREQLRAAIEKRKGQYYTPLHPFHHCTQSHHRIPLHHLPILVDGPASLSATQGYTAVPAAGLPACCLCLLESFFGVLEIVRDHGGKAT